MEKSVLTSLNKSNFLTFELCQGLLYSERRKDLKMSM